MNLADHIRDIPDFPKPGILFKDITPLLKHPGAFRECMTRLKAAVGEFSFDAIAAVEARGFLFAAPLALALEKPLIPLRKPGKLPYETVSARYDLEYGQAEIQMHVDAVTPGANVLLVDDVLATGGTMVAARQLVEGQGGHVAACLFVIELAFLNGRAPLNRTPVRSLLTF